jgi:large subunit ribosomal protein L6
MRKELSQEIEVPEDVEVKIDGKNVLVKGPIGELKRELEFGKLEIIQEKGKLILRDKKATKTEKRMMNTLTAHLKNMIQGTQEKFEYKLKICFGHFPFTVKIEGNKAIIKNFLGEKIQRESSIPEGAEMEIKKDIIIIKSLNKEIAGQTAANLEIATKVRGRDKRIFQDGIYIVEKCGRAI